jgi:hypothetical protein
MAAGTGHTVFSIFMLSLALIGGAEMLRVKRAHTETVESRQRMRSETLAWHAAMRRWSRTYYCSCCGSTFVVDENTGAYRP